jgi:hypothetical protein
MPRLLTFLAWANEHWQSAKRATRRRRSNIGLRPSGCSATQTVTPSFRPDGNTGKIWHAADGEQLRIVLGADGLFSSCCRARFAIDDAKNRPIVGDSCRSRVKFESRDFPFEFKSGKS